MAAQVILTFYRNGEAHRVVMKDYGRFGEQYALFLEREVVDALEQSAWVKVEQWHSLTHDDREEDLNHVMLYHLIHKLELTAHRVKTLEEQLDRLEKDGVIAKAEGLDDL